MCAHGGEARAAGTIVSADIDNVYEGLPELLPLIDVLISSKEFPRLLTGIDDSRAALVEIKARYGCALVGLTKGGRGATVLCEGTFLETPAFQVPGGCVDTTGAGDAFHGGFLYGLLQNENIETSLRIGCAVAALGCRGLRRTHRLANACGVGGFPDQLSYFDQRLSH